jgi:hypothetical protein
VCSWGSLIFRAIVHCLQHTTTDENLFAVRYVRGGMIPASDLFSEEAMASIIGTIDLQQAARRLTASAPGSAREFC